MTPPPLHSYLISLRTCASRKVVGRATRRRNSCFVSGRAKTMEAVRVAVGPAWCVGNTDQTITISTAPLAPLPDIKHRKCRFVGWPTRACGGGRVQGWPTDPYPLTLLPQPFRARVRESVALPSSDVESPR